MNRETADGLSTANYRIGIEADDVGTSAVWLDLTEEEAALLARVGARLGEGSHRLTVEIQPGQPSGSERWRRP